MSEHRHIPEPGEMVYTPKPSWGPAFFALGALGLLSGIYAAGFIFPPVLYAVVGAIFALARLPRHRPAAPSATTSACRAGSRSAARALPVETDHPAER